MFRAACSVGLGDSEKRIRFGFGAFDGVGGVCGVTGVKRVGAGLMRSMIQLSFVQDYQLYVHIAKFIQTTYSIVPRI